MSKLRKLRSKKVGLPAGTLMHFGEVKTKHPELVLFRYNAGELSEQTATSPTALNLQVSPQETLWVNVYGLHDPTLLAELGNIFNLHPLVLEDILNTDQRPKLDSYDENLYLVTRFFNYDQHSMLIGSEQISIVLGRNFVLTFQERPTGSFVPIRERLRANKGHIRSAGAGYLAYALLDVIVDRYFIALEQIGDDCETLEEELLRKPTSSVLQGIHKLKRESMDLRRAVWPLREVVNSLVRNESGFFDHDTVLYLRDVYDHTVHFIESLESLRDMLAGMLDIYLSSISNRVNMEVRALTVVAMLFMPATLIAGIFGMNFKNMPLLQQPDGFWLAIGMMTAIAIIMGLLFWRRQWLSRR
ncbi:MAG TPA: magnesium/cobalt transporter CorA [Novimethylophilus sp.]|jgi:magnesium transporter|uniref:magnesium/cobalt transporter CorA n=1 Tax=Novimethylophilus sp. TaxID=2137426 RepID=UPI002F3F5964